MTDFDDRILKDAERTFEFIKSEKLRLEPELLLTKWPDYAFMTPLRATYHFGREYRYAFKAAIARHFDRELASDANGLDLGKLLTKRQTLSSVWQARQMADRFGIPYRMYVDFSLEFSSRTRRQYFPQPNQLGPVGNSAVAWLTQFEHYKAELEEAGVLNRIEHVAYTAPAFRNLPNQVSAKDLILGRATSETATYHRAMRTFVDELQILTLQDFRDRLDPEVFDYALELLECERRAWGTPASLNCIRTDHLRPSCFSLQLLEAQKHPVCASCPLSAECAAATDRVITGMAKKGVQTRSVSDRTANAERQRRFRARHRLSKKTTLKPAVHTQF